VDHQTTVYFSMITFCNESTYFFKNSCSIKCYYDFLSYKSAQFPDSLLITGNTVYLSVCELSSLEQYKELLIKLHYTKSHYSIYCIRTNIGKELNLANWQIATQSPSLNLANILFYSISIVTLVAFEWFRQINISPNPLFQQIAKYYIHQYLFLYGTTATASIKEITLWDGH